LLVTETSRREGAVSYLLEVQTAAEIDVIDLTLQVNEAIAGTGEGLCVVFTQHTTAALTLAALEDGAAQDLRTVLPMLVPQIDWQHLPPENSTAHSISAIVGVSVTVPIHDGRLAVSSFQKLVLIEMQGPQTRQVEVHVIPIAP
jgi:secondary thiamine-phosphate synthase enzyme